MPSLTIPLEGTNLIEASAGTGKTHAITILFLRLILQKPLEVGQILVVTFTEAATEELRLKVRERLRQAADAFLNGGDPEYELIDTLVREHGDPKEGYGRIRAAMRDFDEAAIFTIHGFCNRVLKERAFESNGLFDTELVADSEKLKLEIVEDFWRQKLYNETALFTNHVIGSTSPGKLLSLVGPHVCRPGLVIVPEIREIDSTEQEKRFVRRFQAVADSWRSSRNEVERVLMDDPALNRNKYRKSSVPVWIRDLDACVARGPDNPFLFKMFVKFTSGVIAESSKRNQSPPSHPFFDLCEELETARTELAGAFEKRLLNLKAELFAFVREELETRKKILNIQSFDDILLDLHSALGGKYGDTLAESVGEKYHAALIDEFQDTDPIQYDIFRRIFQARNIPLFLIGDPKQAIYAFRGADIFTYMDAKKRVEQSKKATLAQNWRSDPKLVEAVNTLFSANENPFLYDGIEFVRVAAADRKDRRELRIAGDRSECEIPLPSLRIWHADARKLGEKGKPINKTTGKNLIFRAVASEIARLLTLAGKNAAMLADRPLEAGDIAVLVMRNREAKLMQEALSMVNVQSVLHAAGNIFDSREALEMERLLAGIVEPGNEKLLRAAMSTELYGVTGEHMQYLIANESAWEELLVKFREYRRLWAEYGFIRMFRYLVSEENVLVRLMSLTDGERRNTNLLHLAEIIHRVCMEKKLSMPGAVKWLAEQRSPETSRSEEHVLRLESDENAVKIVTVHKSKGLEYPVVFCPFLWDDFKMFKGAPLLFHEGGDALRTVLDIGPDESGEHRAAAEKERLAENMRLLYVALTRAENRCYFTWGRFYGAETSAAAYLLHGETGQHTNGAMPLSDEEIRVRLEAVRDLSGGTVGLTEISDIREEIHVPQPQSVGKMRCRDFEGPIDNSHRISSFSSLLSGRPHSEELADYDQEEEEEIEIPEIDEESEPVMDVFSFPRGAKAGTFLHDIFENLDFTGNDARKREELAETKLSEYGFDTAWRDVVCGMAERVVTAPLEAGRDDFILSRISEKDRINELEFHFPLKKTSPRLLKNLFESHAGNGVPGDFPERAGRLSFSQARGFMKGFIDLVFQFDGRFWLVDWKSNHLGNSVQDYGTESMTAAMKRGYYNLQYLIYATALDRHLALRMPDYSYETHFGGVFYIFLRGVDASAGDYGIFRDRPPKELIEDLRCGLIDL